MSQTKTEPKTVSSNDRRAPTTYVIHEVLAQRWSPRAFSSQPVEGEKLQSMFEAARWAASSANVQPWRFLIARHGEASFDKLHDCLVDGNKPWTQNVPVLLLSLTDTMFPARDGKPARENPTARHDLGLAFANLSFQATELGLHLHPMAGFDKEKVKEAFGIPSPYEPVTVTALGYLAESSTLSGSLREREEAPRARKPLKELVFEGDWGKPAEL